MMKPAATTSHLIYIVWSLCAIQCKFSCELLQNLLLSQFEQRYVRTCALIPLFFGPQAKQCIMVLQESSFFFILLDFYNEIF